MKKEELLGQPITEQAVIHSLMEDILVYLKEVCEKHQLRYFLAYGTLLGAVRHQGFIPWDDDVDVWMPREDYRRLVRILTKEPDARYRLVTFTNCRDYHRPFMKLIDTHTFVIEHTDFDVSYGLWVDIFPLDESGPDRETAYQKLKQLQEKCGRVVSVYMPLKGCSLKRKVGRLFYRGVFTLRGKGRVFENYITEYRRQLNASAADFLMNPFGTDKERDVFERDWFAETKEATFGTHKFCIPAAYDEILTQIYGDYRTLPKEQDRVHHKLEVYWRK